MYLLTLESRHKLIICEYGRSRMLDDVECRNSKLLGQPQRKTCATQLKSKFGLTLRLNKSAWSLVNFKDNTLLPISLNVCNEEGSYTQQNIKNIWKIVISIIKQIIFIYKNVNV